MNQSASNERLPRAWISAVSAASSSSSVPSVLPWRRSPRSQSMSPSRGRRNSRFAASLIRCSISSAACALLAQLRQRHAAHLQVREAARDAVARVHVIAALQAETDRLLVQPDALVDGLDPMRREHREQEVHAGQHRRLVELVREIDAELREPIRVLVLAQRAAQERRERAVRARRQSTIAVLERQADHRAAEQRVALLIASETPPAGSASAGPSTRIWRGIAPSAAGRAASRCRRLRRVREWIRSRAAAALEPRRAAPANRRRTPAPLRGRRRALPESGP